MSWGQYSLLQHGYWDKQNRLWEEDWRRTRELFWLGYNSATTKENQQGRYDLMPLPSDPKPKRISPEEEHKLFFQALSIFKVND